MPIGSTLKNLKPLKTDSNYITSTFKLRIRPFVSFKLTLFSNYKCTRHLLKISPEKF